jgi:hypothetical protein
MTWFLGGDNYLYHFLSDTSATYHPYTCPVFNISQKEPSELSPLILKYSMSYAS